jgi:hypothetical protein
MSAQFEAHGFTEVGRASVAPPAESLVLREHPEHPDMDNAPATKTTLSYPLIGIAPWQFRELLFHPAQMLFITRPRRT